MTTDLTIAGVSIKPGSRVRLNLSLPPLYTKDDLHMAVTVIRGRKPGPTVFISSAIHGDEINGIEIVRQLLLRKNLTRMAGTLIAVPVVNSYGLFHRERYLPDGRDLNRVFPGSANGSLASRLAKTFMDEIVRHCDYGIDLHTATRHRTNLPQVRINRGNEDAERLAHAFGAPVIMRSEIREGSLRSACAELGITTLVYEAGEALRHDRPSIRGGVAGILNVLAELNMLPKKGKKSAASPFIAQSSMWVRANASGILVPKVRLGERVAKGQVLGELVEPTDVGSEKLVAPRAGIVISTCELPLMYEGEAAFHLAFFDDLGDAVAEVESFVELHEKPMPVADT